MTETQAIYDGPGLAAMADAVIGGASNSPAGPAQASYDGPGLMSALDAVLDGPEAG
jgi:hypothetical protein